MNEILTITIAKQVFHIEKDAYHTLDAYLKSIRNKFQSYPDKDEIVFDIEARIAEHLKNKNPDQVVAFEDVKKIIAEMGQPEDIDDNQEQKSKSESKSESQSGPRRLYRNMDDALIGGVGSGIASYFGIDPLIVRLILVASLFAGGSGIIIYILFWILTPEANTPTEKLQMQGKPVTIESVKEMAEKGAENIKKSTLAKKIGRVIAAVFTTIGKIIKVIIKVIAFIVGLAILIAGTVAAVALCIAFVTTLVNAQSPYVDSPFLQSLSASMFFIITTLGFIFLFVLALFLFFLGKIILSGKNTIPSRVGFTLLGIWLGAAILLTALVPRLINDYKNFTANNPEYRQETRTVALPQFHSMIIPHSYDVTLIQSPVQEVKISAKAKDLDDITLQVEDGVLTLKQEKKFSICIFCFDNDAELEIRIPHIEKIAAYNSSRVTTSQFNFNNLALDVSNSSRVTLEKITANTINTELENSALVEATGAVKTLNVQAENSSSLRAFDLIAEDVKVRATNSSRVRVNAVKTLEVDASNSSKIDYVGSPTIKERLSNSSRLAPRFSPNPPSEHDFPDFEEYDW